MPSYFYHLAFELYSDPASPPLDSRAIDSHCEYLPPPETDIFKAALPVHRVAPWGAEKSTRQLHRRTKTEDGRPRRQRLQSDARPDSTAQLQEDLKSTGLPPAGSIDKPSFRVAQRSKESQKEHRIQDWRFDAVSIQSVDMTTDISATGPGRPRGKSQSQSTHAGTSSSGPATRGRFIPSDPKNTDVGWGVVHLYRDAQETPGLYDETSSGDDGESDEAQFDKEDCTTLCILAVPSYMTPSDLLGFVGEQTREDVSHFRLIRTGRANKYMVLMKFRDAKKARAWRKEWNGKLFNSMEAEYCHVVFVKSITFHTPDSAQHSSFPDMSNDPFVPKPQNAVKSSSLALESPSSLAAPLTTKPLAPPTPNLVELPTCPVCLERMDETTGLLTILCQHVFHCACLEKWRGSGCPVCRYTQNSSIPGRRAAPGEDIENQCSVCGAESNLWICLICGNVGCGRYDSAHAFAHYEATAHSYAMDIATQHVWDYAGDGYVHRLIQNKADGGKLVDLPAAARYSAKNPSGNMTGLGADMVPREKMEAMGAEYAYLLTSQLDSQRLYFETQLERAVDKAAQAAAAAERAATQLDALRTEMRKLTKDADELRSALAAAERDADRLRRRADRADELARSSTRECREEQAMNKALLERLRFLDARLADAEAKQAEAEQRANDLQEQNRDLTFFISGAQKLRDMDMGDDVVEATLEVPPTEQGAAASARKNGKKKGKRKG